MTWGLNKCVRHKATVVATALACFFMVHTALGQRHEGGHAPSVHISSLAAQPSFHEAQPSFSGGSSPATSITYRSSAAPAYGFSSQRGTTAPPSHRASPVQLGRPSAPASVGSAQARPAYSAPGVHNALPTTSPQSTAPAGHLGEWLNQHSNLPPGEQERMLRADPSFGRLPGEQQQRLVQQLRHVDQMNEQQRRRRLERSERIEHMSLQERMSLYRSNQVFSALPANRQSLMKRAFQDLRSVPPDQRQTVLNSAHYQSTFSPEERAILNDFLRVEPYEPPR